LTPRSARRQPEIGFPARFALGAQVSVFTCPFAATVHVDGDPRGSWRPATATGGPLPRIPASRSGFNQMSDLEKALSIAVAAHRGQKDRNGEPYILHPIRVMCRVTSPAARIVAILHDVVEDTDWTFERLAAEGFGPDILLALDCVTKRYGEAYDDFVRRSASDPVAREVKLADLEDNMDLRRLDAVDSTDASRLDRYVRAWRFLRGRS
jgi:hypothetical protein